MSRLHPILIASLGVLSGAVLDGLVKAITELRGIDVLTVASWRYATGAIFAVAVFALTRKPIPHWPAIRFHLMRAVIQMTAAVTFFWSLSQLALAEATVLGFTAALMLAPLAQIILGEKMTFVSVLAAIIGFAGAIIAMSGDTSGAPIDGNRSLGIVAVGIAAVTYAISIILLRKRTQIEDSVTIVMMSNLLPALIIVPIAILISLYGPNEILGSPVGQFPDIEIIPVLIAIGFFGMGIWWMFTLAYARAPARTLAPIEYTALIWAAIIGYIFFDEYPSWQLFVGAIIIICACLLIAFDSDGNLIGKRFAKFRKIS